MTAFRRPSFESFGGAEVNDTTEAVPKRKKRGSSASEASTRRTSESPAVEAPKRVKVDGLMSVFLGNRETGVKAAQPKSGERTQDAAARLQDERRPAESSESAAANVDNRTITTERDLETVERAESEADNTAETADKSETYEVWSMRDLRTDELNLTEVVVSLDHDLTSHAAEAHHDETVVAETPPAVVQAATELPTAERIRSQPEQQHQARMQPERPPMPEPAPVTADEALRRSYLERQHFPVETVDSAQQVAYMHAAPVSVTPNVQRAVPAREQLVTRREMELAVDNARRRGVGAVWLVGGIIYLYQRHKRKKLEKVHANAQRTAHKEYKKAQEDFRFASEEQTRKQEQVERQGIKTQQQLEANRVLLEKLTAQKNEQAQAFLEGLPKIAEGNRLDMQGAYAEEINKKTGKRAEQPSFRHGAEYYKDQKEIAPKVLRSAAAGEVALVAAAISQRTAAAGRGTMLPAAAPIPSATTQGVPSRARTNAKVASKDDKRATQAQPIWPWLIALAVVVVCLALVLR